MEDVNKRRRISFSLFKLACGPQEINSREIRLTSDFQQIGIIATKIEETGIHFRTNVFAAVAVVDAKAPYYNEERGAGNENWERENKKMGTKPNLNASPISNFVPVLCFVPIFHLPVARARSQPPVPCFISIHLQKAS